MKKLLYSSLVEPLWVALALCSLVIFICGAWEKLLAIEDLAPVGSGVYVVTLEHQDKYLKGESVPEREAEYIGETQKGWRLYDENLRPKGNADHLPQGYVEWDAFKGAEWPGGKTGIPIIVSTFKFKDGTEISGDECWWKFSNEGLNEKYRERLKKQFSLFITGILKGKLKIAGKSPVEIENFLNDNQIKREIESIIKETIGDKTAGN